MAVNKIKYHEIVSMLEKIHVLRRIFCQQATHGSELHFSQIPVIKYIESHDNCTQIDIADALQVSPACIATSTKRLQKSGMVTKTVDNDNLRCKRISLTDKCRNTIKEHKETFNRYDEQIFGGLSNEDLETLSKLLDKIIYNMEEAIGEKHIDNDMNTVHKLINKLKGEDI